MRIDLKCADCGSNRFTLDEGTTDDAHVECADCGHQIGTMFELKERVAAQVLAHSEGRLPSAA